MAFFCSLCRRGRLSAVAGSVTHGLAVWEGCFTFFWCKFPYVEKIVFSLIEPVNSTTGAGEYQFQTRFCMRHSLLVCWYNDEIFSVRLLITAAFIHYYYSDVQNMSPLIFLLLWFCWCIRITAAYCFIAPLTIYDRWLVWRFLCWR